MTCMDAVVSQNSAEQNANEKRMLKRLILINTDPNVAEKVRFYP